jgi:outer membrane biosynthesis protein TonB
MFKKIALTVIGIHLAGIFFLLLSPVKPSKLPPQKFVVQTHTFKQAQKHSSQHPVQAKKTSQTPPAKKAPSTQKTPKSKSIPTKKTEPKNQDIKTPIETRKKAVSKKMQPDPLDLQKKIVKELEEIVAKIEDQHEEIIPPSSLQESSISLQNTATVFVANPEESYQNNLLSYLYEALHLPEQGEVKMQLTIKEDGSLAKMVVLKAESVKNRNYLEKQLPLLRFPYLQDLRVKEKTFILTFCNEFKN